MTKVTKYYADGYYNPFETEEEALRAEEQFKELQKKWQDNSPLSLKEKLFTDIYNALYIPADFVSACSPAAVQIKHMVQVCQKFAEDHKQYLSYY